MKQIFHILIACTFQITLFAQSVTFNILFADYRPRDIKEAPDGSYIVVGTYTTGKYNYPINHDKTDLWVAKFDIYGNNIWSKTYGDTLEDSANCIILTNDSNFLVVGIKDYYVGNGMSQHGDGWVLKLNNQGDTIWSKTFKGGNNNYCDNFVSSLQTADSCFIVVGWKNNSYPNFYGAPWLLKLNFFGDTLFTKTYRTNANPSFFEYAFSVEVCHDSNYITYFSSGYTIMFNDSLDYLWAKFISNNMPFGAYLQDSNIYTYGTTNSGICYILRLNQFGSIVDSISFGKSNHYLFPYSIKITYDSNIVICGMATASKYGSVGWVGKISKTGVWHWFKIYGNMNTTSTFYDGYSDIIQASDSCYVLTGTYDSKGSLLKIDENGDLVFTTYLIYENENSIICYPNPANDFTNIKITIPEAKNEQISIAIYNTQGELKIQTQKEVDINGELNFNQSLQNLNSGIYYIKLNYKNIVITKKLLISK